MKVSTKENTLVHLLKSLIDNRTTKCMDCNRGHINSNFDKATYFHKDYSLPATDCQFLTLSMVEPFIELSNDHHGMIEKNF